MPQYDLPDGELAAYRSTVAAPADLAEFWDSTLLEARSASWPPSLDPVETGLRVVDTFDVTFSGYCGEPIKAWLHVPAGINAPLPVVVRYPGYGSGRGLPHQTGIWSLAGYASLVIDNRGQGAQGGYPGDTPDCDRTGAAFPGFLTRGILDRNAYYYRRLYTDAVLAVDAAGRIDLIDGNQIAVHGVSQGGGIALAVAGLASNLTAVIAEVPALCDMRRAASLALAGPYLEITGFLATYRQYIDRVFDVLAYFDGVVLGQRATAPALFSVAHMDQMCPPSTVYAAYNAYGGPADLRSYPFNGHEGGQFHHEMEALRWLAQRMPAGWPETRADEEGRAAGDLRDAAVLNATAVTGEDHVNITRPAAD